MQLCLVVLEMEWAAIIILLYVSGSVLVSVRGRQSGSHGAAYNCWLSEVLHLGGQGSETSNWTTAVWMEKHRDRRLSPFPWVESLYCTIGLIWEEVVVRIGPDYDFIIMQTFSQSSDSSSFFSTLVTEWHCWAPPFVIIMIYVSWVGLCFKSCICLCFTVSFWVLENRLSSKIPQILLSQSQW